MKLDGSIWFLIAVFVVGGIWSFFNRRREANKIQSEVIQVDVGEQEYRVRFTVARADQKLPSFMAGTIIRATIDARIATGWRTLGEQTLNFNSDLGYDRGMRVRMANEVVEAFLRTANRSRPVSAPQP